MTPERWQELKKVLAAALELEPAERSAYLDRACPEPSVRSEVESLIAANDNGDSRFLAQHSVELKQGTKLGPYEIIALVGAGGMGEVYRARDTRLNRIVAIKVLPSYAADRDGVRERFEREAQAISSLNNPHICTLYDIGHQNGTDYLVMEYLEGETLAQRLKKAPLPLDQALRYAIEIADALDKAHRKGITHRDLKPGNIMLTKSGAKLLDFGLAKLRQEAASSAVSFSQLSTKDPITERGVILGTLQYMAPEQVEGGEVDARSDIFAFGVVVYEMATAKKAFEGKSQASLIAKILETDPPPISSLQPMTPPQLDRVVKKCLAKEPEKRWQSASDICDELKWIAEERAPSSSSAEVPFASPRKNWLQAVAWFGAALAACVIVGLAVWMLKPATPLPVTRTVITLPPDQQMANPDQPLVAISPDGKELAYIALSGGTPQLFLRAMDGLDAHLIPGTNGARSPFFSPDSQWVGFVQSGSLKKISINGGAATTPGPAILGDGPFGVNWSSQGTIILSPFGLRPLYQMSDAGGDLVALTKLESPDITHRWPDVLPGGQAVLFVAASSPSDSRIVVRSMRTGEQRNLVQGATYPRFAPTGHLIYAQGRTLMSAPFDPGRLQVKGVGVPVVEGLVVAAATGAAQYSISRTGTLVYVSGGSTTAQRKLAWVNRTGSEEILSAHARGYGYPRISPEGKRAAVEVENQIWLYDLTRDTETPFTFEGSANQSPVWTTDGKRIAFYSNKEGPANIFWQLADGGGGLERLGTSPNGQVPRSFSPDGFLAFHENNPVTKKDIWVLRISDRKAEPFLRTPANEGGPAFSPDGHWLAYISDESGRQEIYVQPYPGPGGKWQISTDGGSEPAWNRNGRELFYRSGNKMIAVEVTTQPTFTAGKSKVLFEGKYFAVQPPLTGTAYDVSPDGQRFLMVKETEAASSSVQINVVQNWFEELKQRVPSGTK